MFEKFNPFKEKIEKASLSEEEKLAKRQAFLAESEKDFAKAKEIAATMPDERLRKAALNHIAELEEGGIHRREEKAIENMADAQVDDMRDAINSGDLKGAKKIASILAKDDENFGARAFLEIAQAEMRNGIDPEGSILTAKEIVRKGQDPYFNMAAFSDIMRLEAAQELFDKAEQTAVEMKSLEKTEPDWDEYNARLFATIAGAEKSIGEKK